MCIDYNHLIGTLLEFISNSWNDIKASEYSNNTIFRTYCCGEMERQYNNENDCLMLNCCGEEYSEDEFEMCRDCGNYIHNSVSEYDEETDEFYCGGCI